MDSRVNRLSVDPGSIKADAGSPGDVELRRGGTRFTRLIGGMGSLATSAVTGFREVLAQGLATPDMSSAGIDESRSGLRVVDAVLAAGVYTMAYVVTGSIVMAVSTLRGEPAPSVPLIQ